MLPSHDRFKYSPIVKRPGFSWPDGKRLAVYVALAVEHFAYNAMGLGASYSPGIPHPNTYNWAWREYGNRVGGWRLIELFDELKLPMGALVNSECCEHCPELLDVLRSRGDEIIAHGRTNSLHPNGLPLAEEREMIENVTATFAKAHDQRPLGWMSSGANPSDKTEDLLAQAGYTYTLDWPMDDQPTWMRTQHGPFLSVPYPHEVNDVPMIMLHDGTANAFADMVVDNFDEMLVQSKSQPLVYGITIHTFIMGQPYRLRKFRQALEYMKKAGADVWFTTPGKIADHYAKVIPAPAEMRE